MPYKGRDKHEVTRKIANLPEYLRLREIRANTGLIDGKPYYNGQSFEQKEYDELFPEPTLIYRVEQIDGRQIENLP